MTKTIEYGIVTLIADDGAYLTNEQGFTTKVYLGKNASENEWRDATAEEYEEWMRKQEEADPTTDDIINTLFGGDAE